MNYLQFSESLVSHEGTLNPFFSIFAAIFSLTEGWSPLPQRSFLYPSLIVIAA